MKDLCQKEVAAHFDISEQTVRRMMAAGHIRLFVSAQNCGAQIKASLDDYINTGHYGPYVSNLALVTDALQAG